MTNQFKKYSLISHGYTRENLPRWSKGEGAFQQKDWSFEDNHLKTRTEIDAFKAKYNLQTTPLIFIDGQQIGDYSDLSEFLGEK